jgi:hypothetical protein
VQPSSNPKWGSAGRTVLRLAWAGGISLGLCGCASFWDEVTSRNFTPGKLFTRPDPLVVLKDSDDGSERHKALAALREPAQNGGSNEDQEIILKILKTAATADQQPLCRMAAIRALGRFKDPRAAELLEEVYLQNLTFGQEMNGLIRQECLASMAETGGPVALRRLVLVAREPAANGTDQDRQETLDRRLAAVRGLAKFKDPQATETLAHVLRSEKDIALRDVAHESLQVSTGKHLAPDSPQWETYLRTPPDVQPAGGVVPGSHTSATGTGIPSQPVPTPLR